MEQNSPHNPSHLSRTDRDHNRTRSPWKVSKIYDPLGLSAPINLEGKHKMLYRTACETRIPWDQGEHEQWLHLAKIRKKSPIMQQRKKSIVSVFALSVTQAAKDCQQHVCHNAATIRHIERTNCIKVQDREERTGNTQARTGSWA